MTPVFTPAGSRAFDAWFEERLDELTADVRRALGEGLVALVLGGGYGRGEGGVVRAGGVERPYNDLDLVLVTRGQAVMTHALEPVALRHERALGIAVDFSRPLTVGDIARWEHRLRWHELYHGHHVLTGDTAVILAHAPDRIASPVPPREAARLLVNRGAGLVWAERILRGMEPSPDPDFVRRNAYKAMLAAGDARVIAAGLLAPRHAGRLPMLRALVRDQPRGEAERLVGAYRRALTFKFEPDSVAAEDPAELFVHAVALWTAAFLEIESARHGVGWASLSDYADWTGPREPRPPARWVRNLLSNLRFLDPSVRAPQDALYGQVARLLDARAHGASWERASAAFLRRWRCVND